MVLLDEVEKAHPEVLNLLLQMLEEGQLTDGTGQPVSFRDTVVILTSNLGSDAVSAKSCGFVRQEGAALAKERVMAAVKQALRPELLARLDGVVLFQPLGREHLRDILRRELEELARMCRRQNVTLCWDERAEQALLVGCGDPALGARPLRQMVEKQAEDPLAAAILAGAAGKTARLTAENGAVMVLWEQPAPTEV